MPDSMNEEQKRAILHGTGPMLVLAGPGSGKTFVLTRRIQNLIQNFHVEPNHILVITFTKAAALEMQARALKLEPEAKRVHFGTFHSIFYKILLLSGKYSGYQLSKISLQRSILTTILYTLQYDSDEITNLVDSILKEISYIKNAGISVENYESKTMEPELFRKSYHQYNNELHRKKYLDFDDMLLLCYEHLRVNEAERAKWQEQFQYILIDEFQDINAVQYGIVKMLTQNRKNLFVVGDDDQAIYGFRGSDPRFMKQFLEDYQEAEQVLLKINYRCDKKIVELAKRSIDHNTIRFPKEIVSGKMEKGLILIEEKASKEEEVKWICQKIKENENKTIAILYRTKRNAMYFSEKLFALGIEATQKDTAENFYEHFILRDILSYFYYVSGERTRFHFLQFMNKPSRYISRTAIKNELINEGEILKFYQGKDEVRRNIQELFADLRFMEHCDPYSALMYLEHKVGYKAYVKELAGGRAEKWQEYEAVLKELEIRIKEYSTIEEFLSFVSEYTEFCGGDGKSGAVSMMTYHSAKGLEFDCVFMPGLNDGVLPHPRAVSAMEIEEERRMFYVALTRAREKLYLSFINQDEETDSKSLFLRELENSD